MIRNCLQGTWTVVTKSSCVDSHFTHSKVEQILKFDGKKNSGILDFKIYALITVQSDLVEIFSFQQGSQPLTSDTMFPKKIRVNLKRRKF